MFFLGGAGTSWVGAVPPGWACRVRLEHRFADIGWGWEFSHGPLLNPRRESSRGVPKGTGCGNQRACKAPFGCRSMPVRAGPCWTVLDRAGPCWTMSDLWCDGGVMVGGCGVIVGS